MAEPHLLLGFIVNNAERLGCLLHRYRRVRWLGPSDSVHGWGVGHYLSGKPLLRSQPGPLQQELQLGDLLREGTGTPLLLAHACLTGAPQHSAEDMQPLRFRRWLFAQQGLIDLGDRGVELLGELPQFLRQGRTGRLGTELPFLGFLGELHREQALDHRAAPEDLALCLRDAVEPLGTSINILTTNGHLLLAYRSAGPLLYSTVDGIEECERCGISASTRRLPALVESHRRFKGMCVATRPLGTPEPWHEIADRQLLVVGPSLDVQLVPGPE